MPFVNLSRILNSFSVIAVIVFACALLTSVAFPTDARYGQFLQGGIPVEPQTGPGVASTAPGAMSTRTTRSSGGRASRDTRQSVQVVDAGGPDGRPFTVTVTGIPERP